MHKSKIIVLLFVIFAILLNMTSAVMANDTEEKPGFIEEKIIEYHGNGYFTKASDVDKGKEFRVTDYKGKFYKIIDNKDLPFDMVVKVRDGVFQATKELIIDKKQYKDIKSLINKYDIPEHMLDIVYQYYNEENLNPDAQLIIYSPNFITTKNEADDNQITVSGMSSNYYYYWGTGGYYYKHEDLFVTNWTSNWASRGVNESAWNQYIWSVFNNTVSTIIDTVFSTNPYTGTAYTIASILYCPDLITGSDFQNTVACQKVEDKHIQYESIQYPGSEMSLKVISERSVVDWHVSTTVDGEFEDDYEYNIVWQGPNFSNISTLCYNCRNNTIVYREEVYQYYKLGFQFTSY